MFKRLLARPATSSIALAFLIIAMCLPVFGFNRIPLHDLLHALMHYNFVTRDWVVAESLLSLWNPYREYGMHLFVEHIFNFHPFQYITLIFAKVFPDQNTITATKLVYVCVNSVFAIGLYKLLLKITGCKFSAIFSAITAGLFFPWFASPSFNLVAVWLLPLCYYLVILFIETGKIKWILLSLVFLTFSCFQGNGYLGMNTILAYLAALLGYFYQFQSLRLPRKQLFNSPLSIGLIVVIGSGLFVGLYFLHLEFTEQFFLSRQRSSSTGETDLSMFLTFATPPSLAHFSGFWHGVSTSRDGVAYAGFLVPAFALYGLLFSANFRAYVPYLASFLIILGLALGAVSFVSLIVFHFPGFSFYRHLGLLLPIAKFHLVIIAAIGLAAFLAHLRVLGEKEITKRLLYVLLPVLIVAISCTVLSLSLGATANGGDFYGHSRYALLGCLCVTLLVGYKRFVTEASGSRNIGLLILAVVLVDGLSFYSEQAFEYTVQISDTSYDIFRASNDFTYESERYFDAYQDADFANLINEFENKPNIWQVSATYDSTYGATDTEPCYSAFRRFSSSIYLKPLYEALMAIDGRTYPMESFEKKMEQVVSSQVKSAQPLENSFPNLLYSVSEKNVIAFNGMVYSVPQSLGNISLDSWRSGAVANLSGVEVTQYVSRQPTLLQQSIGCESPKIRLVDQCHVSVSNDQESVASLLNIAHSSESPFTLHVADQHGLLIQESSCGTQNVTSDIKVTSFNPGKISVLLDSIEAKDWLYLGYSWNSKIKILVDGEERPVYRTNLGFISTPLSVGDRQVIIYRTQPTLWPRVVLMLSNIFICIAIFIVLLKKTAHISPHESRKD